MAHPINTTRGVPFEPGAANAQRTEQQIAAARTEQAQQARQKRKRRHQEIDDAYFERRTGKSRLSR